MSKLPAPSVSMPCDCRILQSLTKGQVKLVLFETVQLSPLVIGFDSKYDVLVKVSACTYFGGCIVPLRSGQAHQNSG